jgi:hypothetical protein
MNNNVALGLEITGGFLALIAIGYGVYSYSQNKENQAIQDSVVRSYNTANNITQQPAVEQSNNGSYFNNLFNNSGYNSGDEGVVQGGRKKSKRRKGRKNASKKRR